MPEFEITKTAMVDVSWNDINTLVEQGKDPADYALEVAHIVDAWDIVVTRYDDDIL